jgi:hypothetical protein
MCFATLEPSITESVSGNVDTASKNLRAGFVPENGAKSRTILGGSGSPDHCGEFVRENGVKVPTMILDVAG